MLNVDSKRKKIYDATVNMILNLHLQQNKLSKEEMHCLLSLLDLIIMGKNDLGLVGLLQEWESSQPEAELQEILKAVLLTMDYTDLDSQQGNIDTIRDLLRYNKKLRESP